VNRQRLLQIAKWTWLVLVFGGVIYYFAKHYTSVIAHLQNFSLISLVLSIVFLVVGKYLLTYLSLWSIEGQDWRPAFSQMFYINAVTQLAKYLPGGIWHFVGRFGLYRSKGMTTTQSGRTMLVENLWLVLSAFCFGCLVSFFGQSSVILNWLHLPSTPLIRGSLFLLFILVWFLGLFLIEHFVKLKCQAGAGNLVRLVLLQAAAWLFMGLGFWVILPNGWNWELIGASVGGFALSWVVGYLTIFAPSGLGVREVVLTALLAVYITPEGAAVYATVARLIWIITEIGLGVFSELVFGSGNLCSLLKNRPPAASEQKENQTEELP
jgi:uncharacterized membrane protein YbhN (UPF0104 family)